MKENIEIGGLYSRNYLKKDKLVDDSERFRNRIAAYFNKKAVDINARNFCGINIEIELGISIDKTCYIDGTQKYNLDILFLSDDISDVLGSITLIYKYGVIARDDWKNFVERVFREEGLNYTLDEKCGVHPYVDEEFQQNKLTTLRCLEKEGLTAVKHEFEQAFENLRSNNKDNKGAIKAINEAIETLVKNMNGLENVNNLDKAIPKLKNVIEKAYKDDKIIIDASKQMVESLRQWNSSCHQYRHGQKTTKPNQPTDEYTILMLSQGASYIRWLLDIEKLYIDSTNKEEIAVQTEGQLAMTN